MTSTSLMHETGQPKKVLWDNPEGQGGQGDGRGVHDGGDSCIPMPIHVDVWQKPSQYCKLVIVQLK